MNDSIEAMCLKVGEMLANAEDMTRHLMDHPDLFTSERMREVGGLLPAVLTDKTAGEIKANIMLAVRHLEDAQARLGFAAKHAELGRRRPS